MPGKTKEVKREEVQQLKAKLNELASQYGAITTQIEESTTGNRKPRGVRTTLKRLEQFDCVLKATAAILELYISGTQEALNSLEKGKLLMAYKTRGGQMNSLQEKLQTYASVMSQALGENDDDAADAAARDLHKEALSLDYTSEGLADAIRECTHFYPDEYGQLQLFSYLGMLEPPGSIERIDRTMRLTKHVEVAVADAPLMIEAMKRNDKQAITDIMQRAVEYSF